MIIAILLLCLCIVLLSNSAQAIEKRVAKLERETPAKIEQAKHEGWLDGVLYQVEVDKRRHPRDPKTKQFVSRT